VALPFFSIGVLCFWGALEVIESLWAILFFFGFVPPPLPPLPCVPKGLLGGFWWLGFFVTGGLLGGGVRLGHRVVLCR